jgi:hypothetical protein
MNADKNFSPQSETVLQGSLPRDNKNFTTEPTEPTEIFKMSESLCVLNILCVLCELCGEKHLRGLS